MVLNIIFNVTLVAYQALARVIFKIRVWNVGYQIRKRRMAEYNARKREQARKILYEQNRKEMLMEMFPDKAKSGVPSQPGMSINLVDAVSKTSGAAAKNGGDTKIPLKARGARPAPNSNKIDKEREQSQKGGKLINTSKQDQLVSVSISNQQEYSSALFMMDDSQLDKEEPAAGLQRKPIPRKLSDESAGKLTKSQKWSLQANYPNLGLSKAER